LVSFLTPYPLPWASVSSSLLGGVLRAVAHFCAQWDPPTSSQMVSLI
jgi:hypothetical protein